MTLALDYRPRTFDEVVGQRPVRLVLQQMVKQGKIPSALAFIGSRGTGKTTTARILAAALNCDYGAPCGTCPSCKAVQTGNSPDVLEIDAASNGLIADIRDLKKTVMYSVPGKYRVVLLDEAHSISIPGSNALLKVLEEPPPSTLFVLLTTEGGAILETIMSRCMSFEFKRISTADIVGRLKHIASEQSITIDDELLLLLAERANGGMRDAVMTLDQISRVGVRTVDQFAKVMGESDFAPALFTHIVNADIAAAFSMVDEQMLRTGDSAAVSSQLVALMRDVLVLASGGSVARQGQALAARQALVPRVSPEQLFAAMRNLWELKTKYRHGDDPRTALDLAIVMVFEAINGKKTAQVQSAQVAAPAKKLSLDELG